jgi:hypothetical protein
VRGGAELLFVAAFGMVSILLLTLLWPVNPAVCLLSMFIYIWSRERPHDPIDIYGFTFQRWHLPAVTLVLSLIFSVRFDFIAILIGHLWLFITRIVPRVYHKTLLTVPAWWYDGVERYVWQALGGRVEEADRGGARRPAGAGGAAPTAGVDARIPRATWMRGPGHRLDQ